ncbi:secretogranin-2a [Stegostoma tigrinum]|uniref:secretogranin-2a n=1 Tax=Stegostoma tigrinum TaxID=3053191 RepID=UPI00202B9E54|nr:secretogranin-2a [Stegostoma tigrinum]
MAMVKTSPSGMILTLSILLYSDILRAASLVPNIYDLNTLKERMSYYPNPDMIKALEFIENLRQNSEDTAFPDYDERGILRPIQEALLRKVEEDREENEQSDTKRESLDDGRADWAKLSLKTLMQADSNAEANANAYRQQMIDGNQQDYDGPLFERGGRQDLTRKYHLAFPGDSYRINPYKRTNEIIEEEYTPQSLATLESAFRELGKHAEPYRQQERLQEEHFHKDEEDDISRDSEFAYEDAAEGEDSVEVKNRHQHKVVQFDGEETELDGDSERTGTNGKNSLANFDELDLAQPNSLEQGKMKNDNAAADLMLQYYKRLQDRMDEDQAKREVGTAAGDRNGEKETAQNRQVRGSQGDIEPRLMNQLVGLQIYPDDIVQMLQEAERRKDAGAESSQVQADREQLGLRESYPREQSAADSSLEDLTPEDVLNILGLDDGRLRKDPSRNRLFGPDVPVESFPGIGNQQAVGSSEGTAREQPGAGEELTGYLQRLLAADIGLANSAEPPRVSPVGGRHPEAAGSREPLRELLHGMNSRKAAEILSLINHLSGFAGNDYRAPRRQQNGEESLLMIHKLVELLNQQNENQDRSVNELNRGMVDLHD